MVDAEIERYDLGNNEGDIGEAEAMEDAIIGEDGADDEDVCVSAPIHTLNSPNKKLIR